MAKKKPPFKENKRGRKTGTLSKEMQARLKDIFLEDGITPNQAATIVGCDHHTASDYFKKWADELVSEDDHETWIEREARVRKRALEGISKKLTSVKSRLIKFKKILNKLLDPKNQDDERIEQYERIVRLNIILETELQLQYDAIEMRPPAQVILDREVERHIAEKQSIIAAARYQSKNSR